MVRWKAKWCSNIIFNTYNDQTNYKSRPTRAIAQGGLLYTLSFAILIFVAPLSMFYLSIIVMTFGETMITVNNNAFISGMTRQNTEEG